MTSTLSKAVIAAVLSVSLVASFAACGQEDSPSVDPTPEKQSGAPSSEFEPEDIEAAENADRLVEIYCGGTQSEAQTVGCLSHVTVDTVCEQDTATKVDAVSAYIEETGDDSVC